VNAPDNHATQFLALHRPGEPLLMPNPWDIGSARLLESLGFRALATTSGGFAATLGRLDGTVTLNEAINHAGRIVPAVGVPVSADLENGFADDPAGVAETVRRAIGVGLAGCSIEDYSGGSGGAVYDRALAVDRVRAAAETAHANGQHSVVLTGRCENFIRGNPDLKDTIARLQDYQEAGADVLFAPGVVNLDDIRTLVAEVDRPVNVLAFPDSPSVAELAAAGVARISVGGAFANAALAAVIDAARELQQRGTYGYWAQVGAARKDIQAAFAPKP
jgi:2-methylisocitrate lyase-like PEP mutase family enzyme